MSAHGRRIFPNTPPTAEHVDNESRTARLNAPTVVLREMGTVLISALAMICGVDLLLMALHIH